MTNKEKIEQLRVLATHSGWKILSREIRRQIKEAEEYVLADNYLDTGDKELSEASYLRARQEIAIWKQLLDMPTRLAEGFSQSDGEDLEVYDD